MPYAPKKPCANPTCGRLVESGQGSMCEEHRVQSDRGYQRYRGSSYRQGYDGDWERVRLKALKRDHYLCQGDCKAQGILTPAQHVDHIEPFHGKDDPRRLDLNNLQSLCKPCHSRKTVLYDGGLGKRIARKE